MFCWCLVNLVFVVNNAVNELVSFFLKKRKSHERRPTFPSLCPECLNAVNLCVTALNRMGCGRND